MKLRILGGIVAFTGMAGLLYCAALLGGASSHGAFKVALTTTTLCWAVVGGLWLMIDGGKE